MTVTPPPAGARSIASAFAAALALAACAPASDTDDPHLVPPVTGGGSIEAWFAAGYYLAWTCEPALRDPIGSSPHGDVRTCANALAESSTDKLDASLVLEIADDTGAIGGFGSMRRTAAGSDGDVWYWYMRVPLDNATAHDAVGVAADGWGFGADPAADYCTPCHRTAGDGQAGSDMVFVVP